MDEYKLGNYMREVRGKRYSIREVCRRIEESGIAGITISPAYYSQVETGTGINTDKISMDFFWAVGIVLGVDPLSLFVLSRPKIPARYADSKSRNRLFDEHAELAKYI